MTRTPKLPLFIALGVAFWLAGMLLVRLLGPIAFTPGNPLMIVAYLGAFPLLYVSLWLASRVTGTPLTQMLQPTVVMTFTAIFIDGVVIGWLPQAYGDDIGQVMRGAAWLLWGGAVGLLVAWVWARQEQPSLAR